MTSPTRKPDQGASAPTLCPSPQELVVYLLSDYAVSEYRGTRAMLEAEGVIPEGTKWPEGYDDLRWRAGGFDYWLRRRRPEGAKGPRKAFADFDWFSLRWSLTNMRPTPADLEFARKAKELQNFVYRHSAQGCVEWNARFERYQTARQDTEFQAFKAAILPRLAEKKKRGRPRKGSGQSSPTTAEVRI